MEISAVQNSQASASVSSKTERAQLTPGKASEVAKSEKSQGVEGERPSGPTQAAAPASREEVEAAVATIQDFVQSVRRDLNFSLEEGSGRVVVKVMDSGSGDVIRQIPSEEALQLAENLSEVRSLLFKAEA